MSAPSRFKVLPASGTLHVSMQVACDMGWGDLNHHIANCDGSSTDVNQRGLPWTHG
jgi:hypothetical protein